MKEIKRKSVTDSATDLIKEAIISGEYELGKKLPSEANLCEIMQISRTSVREALRTLQALGYVDIKPGKGAFATESLPQSGDSWLTSASFHYEDIMTVRIAIECLTVRLAVEKASGDDLRKLQSVHNSYVEAARKSDTAKLIILDEKFHMTIAEMCDNEFLKNMCQMTQKAFSTYRRNSMLSSRLFPNAIQHHQRILNCVLNRQAERAEEEMRQHLEHSLKDVYSVYGR